jgi:hypothetical protein
MTRTLLIGLAVLGLCSIGQAQQSSTSKSQETSVTGCLQRGTSSGDFTITASDGKKYDLRSSASSVKLEDHVGHRVTIKGTAETGSTKSSSNSKTGTAETLEVSSLSMVSTSCQ